MSKLMTGFSRWLYDASSWRNILIATILFLGLTAAFGPWSEAVDAGQGLRSPDASFGVSVEDAYAYLGSLEVSGRTLYASGELTLDVAYPIVYSLLLGMLLSRLFPLAYRADSLIQPLHLLPFGGGLFDLMENKAAVLLVINYPNRMPGVVHLLNVFNQTKWILGGASVFLLVTSGAVLLVRRIRP